MLTAKPVFRSLFTSLFLFLLIPQLSAARYALIISCRAGNARLHGENKSCCTELLKLLRQKDFKQVDVFFEGGDPELKGSLDVERPAIVEKLKQLGEKLPLKTSYGCFARHASASPQRVSMATKGGRFSGNELGALLDKVKAEQFIFWSQHHGVTA